jgi:hypothetical protein
MWMYFNIGSKDKKVQWFDVDLGLFLWFMCKIWIFMIIHNCLMIISYVEFFLGGYIAIFNNYFKKNIFLMIIKKIFVLKCMQLIENLFSYKLFLAF